MDNRYIAIFDSGVGGFTALIDAVKRFPNENFLFYGDTQHVPYGEKPASLIEELTLKAAENIVRHGVKAIVLACNTATSAAATPLRKKCNIPILGMEPAVKPALLAKKNTPKANRVLLFSTLLTMRGEKLSALIGALDADKRVDCMPLPELVRFAENMDFSGPQVLRYIKQRILSCDMESYGAIVLGCTHFIWYKELLRQQLPPHIKLYDGNAGTLKHLETLLRGQAALNISLHKKQKIKLHFTKNIGDAKAKILEDKLGIPVEWI